MEVTINYNGQAVAVEVTLEVMCLVRKSSHIFLYPFIVFGFTIIYDCF